MLIGASGSGKSTLLRIMSGLETATSGEVIVGGVPMHDPKRAPEIRGHVGMVFQQFNLFPHLDALSNVTLALRKVYKMSEGGSPYEGTRGAGPGRDGRPGRALPQPVVGRPAAACRDRQGARRQSPHHLLRRGDLRARSRTGGRGHLR